MQFVELEVTGTLSEFQIEASLTKTEEDLHTRDTQRSRCSWRGPSCRHIQRPPASHRPGHRSPGGSACGWSWTGRTQRRHCRLPTEQRLVESLHAPER